MCAPRFDSGHLHVTLDTLPCSGTQSCACYGNWRYEFFCEVDVQLMIRHDEICRKYSYICSSDVSDNFGWDDNDLHLQNLNTLL